MVAEGKFIDPDFALTSVHMRYINYAQQHDGIFRKSDFTCSLLRTIADPERLSQQMSWANTTIQRMTQAGWFDQISPDEYQLNPFSDMIVSERLAKRKPKFTLGKNHLTLLRHHENGILTLEKARGHMVRGNPKDRERLDKILKGMIRNLRENSYLELSARGEYTLTVKAMEALGTERPMLERERIEKGKQTPRLVLNLSDAGMLDVIDQRGKVRRTSLEVHASKERITKRLRTLEQNGLIINDMALPSLVSRLEQLQHMKLKRELTLSMLLSEQKKLLHELWTFEQLTIDQVTTYIYGNNPIAEADLRFLDGKKLINVNWIDGLITLSKRGVKLADAEIGDGIDYKPKSLSRPGETEHDLLIYPAYKAIELEITEAGGRIVGTKNDRQLRSEDIRMSGFRPSEQLALPDLRVLYVDADGVERSIDIEADVRYREKTVADKINAYVAGGGDGQQTSAQGNRVDSVSSSIASAFSWTEMLFRDREHIPASATGGRLPNASAAQNSLDWAGGTRNSNSLEHPNPTKEAGQAVPSSGMAWVTKSMSQATRVASVLRAKAQDEGMLGKLRGIFILVMDEYGNLKRFRW